MRGVRDRSAAAASVTGILAALLAAVARWPAQRRSPSPTTATTRSPRPAGAARGRVFGPHLPNWCSPRAAASGSSACCATATTRKRHVALPVVGDAFALNLESASRSCVPDLVVVRHWRAPGAPARAVAGARRAGVRERRSGAWTRSHRRSNGWARCSARGPSVADAQAAALRQRWSALQARYAGRTPVRVFYQLWHQPLMTINGEHLIAQAITARAA